MMAFMLFISDFHVYYTTQVISTDLFSHPKVKELFKKSREINQIFLEDTVLTAPLPLEKGCGVPYHHD